MVTLLTRLDAKDEAAATALAAILSELSGTVPSEPGSPAYEAFGTKEDLTTFYVKESWSSREDADRHARRVETDGYVERSVNLLATPFATVTLLEI
jgi:quinol monooxygenase YgiN